VTRIVGVIGTAGREPSTIPRLKLLYPKMVQTVLGMTTPDDVLQSGGAAWADHVAVSIFKIWSRQGLDAKINLFLPCDFDFTGCYFTGVGAQAETARIANYYHRIFSKAMGSDTLLGLAEVLRMPGCEWYVGEGFKPRNLDVGKCDLLIAQTFAVGSYPADGGTEHCWRNSKALQKIHVSLAGMEP